MTLYIVKVRKQRTSSNWVHCSGEKKEKRKKKKKKIYEYSYVVIINFISIIFNACYLDSLFQFD